MNQILQKKNYQDFFRSNMEIMNIARMVVVTEEEGEKSLIYIYIYIYIVIHRETVSLYHNSSFVYILYLTGYQSVQFVRRALNYASGNRKFLLQSAQPPWGSVYIVIHRQTVSLYHNSSMWLDTWDAWSWDRNPPNFTLGLESDHSTNKRTTSPREL